MTAMLSPIRIGPVEIKEPVILAPMSGVSDLPFRRQVKKYGTGLLVTEMIASQAMIRATRDSLAKARVLDEERPCSVQLAGCEARVMAEAARLNEDLGADIIDINMGCPVKKVVNGFAGSALMRDLSHAAGLIEAVVKAVDVPVTLKMRTGWDHDSRNAPELARIAEDLGVQMLVVHGRTRCQLYRGHADWDFIAEVKAATRLPVIANGDIVTEADAAACLDASGADGVMIGRGTYGRPWFVGQVMHYLRTGETRADPPLAEQLTVILDHYDHMIEHYGPVVGVRMARKHLGWYVKGLPGSAKARDDLNKLSDPALVKDRLRAFFGPHVEQAAA
ncbi:tRNA dihydrouridine synthase DusB [Rhodothalassium salexigens]|uniref:tRNA dihydrouridine synthase DusB n=1 Tax=Rhodothalassium salexigens TaxID=1086 RepID=UPI0031FF1243|nr:tRNA dihydrouridine synthase DusB [Rhodothalassium salexigens]MBK5922048.1 tRNA dihydrouridine synthase DusB [Rhodothalassium salexigens]